MLQLDPQHTDNMVNRWDCGVGEQRLCRAWYVLLENWDISFVRQGNRTNVLIRQGKNWVTFAELLRANGY
jgi:hypothetical protein